MHSCEAQQSEIKMGDYKVVVFQSTLPHEARHTDVEDGGGRDKKIQSTRPREARLPIYAFSFLVLTIYPMKGATFSRS